MMTERQKEIFDLLRQDLAEEVGEMELTEKNGITFLCFTPALYTDGTGLVYMEICLLDYGEEVMIAQVYTTMIPKQGPGLAALRERLNEWNYNSLAGSYGIYEKQGHLYHKQMISLINDAAADDQEDFLLTGICTAMNEMARRLPEALTIMNGGTSD